MKVSFLLISLWALLINQLLYSQSVTLTPVVSGFSVPIDVRYCNDDRIFVAERAGRIKIINPDGTLRSTPFLDISAKISAVKGEQGFFSFAFSPDYKNSGKFYVSYSDSVGTELYLVIEEYRVTAADSNVADPASALPILSVLKQSPSHNGGCITFGQDGYLYVFFGDGSAGGDALGTARNKASLFGKILRIDVSNSSLAQPYAIPPTNPFVDSVGSIRKEIWAFGLRNPWRSSFDRITHDLWIADVGQSAQEEIDFQADSSIGGEDYGWSIEEGTACFLPPTSCVTPNAAKTPIHNYMHPGSRSIIGGYVYRSVQSRDLWGMYIYTDYVNRWIDGLRQSDGVLQGSVVRLLNDAGGSPISFGEDRYGQIYICFIDNPILYKVEDANVNRIPKAYFKVSSPSPGAYQFQANKGKNITYQWLYNNAPINGATQPALTPSLFGHYRLIVTNSLNNKDTSGSFGIFPLPVTFKSFTARRTVSTEVQLSWATTTEQNNKGFEIQRKLSNENTFKTISFVVTKAFNGNSNGELNYLYNDGTAGRGLVQYRIKQVNLDEGFSYSSISLVNAVASPIRIAIMPNPVNGQIHIVTDNIDYYQYKLLDISGKTILQNRFSGNAHAFSAKTLQRGVYYIIIQSVTTKQSVVEKIIVNN